MSGQPTSDPGDGGVSGAASLELTLETALAIAVQDHPDLLVLRHNQPVSLAALAVARTYPFNPVAQLQLVPSPIAADGSTEKTLTQVSLTQTLELAGQRQFRRRAGEAGLERTHWEILRGEAAVMAEAQRRFFQAVYRRDLAELAGSAAGLNEEILAVLQGRFQAGQATAADIALARIEARTARRQADLAQRRFETALRNLQAYLGLRADVPVRLVGGAEDWQWRPVSSLCASGTATPLGLSYPESQGERHYDPDLERLAVALAGERFDVREACADLQVAEAQYQLALANRVPNVSLGPFFERDEGATEFWGILAQMSLPVVNTGGPLAAQRGAELQQKRIAVEQAARKAEAQIGASLRRYDRARRLVESVRHDLADLEGDVQKVQNLFEAGQVDLLRVSAARNQAVVLRQTHLEALNELAQAAADLTETTGLPPHAVVVTRRDAQSCPPLWNGS